MAMKQSNKILFILTAVMLVVSVPVIFKTASGKKHQSLNQIPTANSPTADTALDTLKGFQAEMEAANQRLETLQAENINLRQTRGNNQNLLEKLQQQNIEQQQAQQQLQAKLTDVLAALNKPQPSLAPTQRISQSSKINMDGIPRGLGFDALMPSDTPLDPSRSGRWLAPLDQAEQSGKQTPSGFERLLKPSLAKAPKNTVIAKTPQSTPRAMMTIAKTAVGLDAVAWTALIGRVPVKGKVSDPYPAKFILGKEVLMANGHQLPGVEAAFVSGISQGDRALACVSVQLKTLSFIFSDGRIVTHEANNNDVLGWVSDEQGWPCISGKLISNASAGRVKNALANTVSAAGEALAETQETVRTGVLGDANRFVSGDTAQFILGKVASQSARDISSWLAEQADNSFDAVIVPPNKKVAIHFEQTLHIDYDPSGRKTVYAHKEVDPYALD